MFRKRRQESDEQDEDDDEEDDEEDSGSSRGNRPTGPFSFIFDLMSGRLWQSKHLTFSD